METLICTLCVTEKPVSEFYKNKGMSSGYANQCKECVKSRSKERERVLSQDPAWVEKEKIRAREKYNRLGYCQKQKEWDQDKPWKNTVAYKNLHKKLNLTNKQSAHHWNYNLLKDVFIVSKKLHKKIHKYIELDMESLCFVTMEGNLLDTKSKHDQYIKAIMSIEKIQEIYE